MKKSPMLSRYETIGGMAELAGNDDVALTQSFFQYYEKKDPLSSKETRKLVRLAQKGDRHALNTLLCHNLGLVVMVAKKYINLLSRQSALDLSDLVQEGNLGFLEAVETYRQNKSQLSTFAVLCIRRKMTRTIEDQYSTIKIPVYKQRLHTELRNAKRKYREELDTEPSTNDLSGLMNKSEDEIQRIINEEQEIRHIMSLDFVKSDEKGEERFFYETITDKKYLSPPSNNNANDCLYKSTKRMKLIVDMLYSICDKPKSIEMFIRRYGLNDSREPETLQELANDFGLTRERVRQTIKDHILSKLHKKCGLSEDDTWIMEEVERIKGLEHLTGVWVHIA